MRALLDEYQAFVSRYYRASWDTHSQGFEMFAEMYAALVRSGKFGKKTDGAVESELSSGLQGTEEMGEAEGKEKDAEEEKEKGKEEEDVEHSDSTLRSAAPRRTKTRSAISRRNISQEFVSDSDKEDGAALIGNSPHSKGVPYVDLKTRSTTSSLVVRRSKSEAVPDPQEVPSNVRPRRNRASTKEPVDDVGQFDQLPDESPSPTKPVVGKSGSAPTLRKSAALIDAYLAKNARKSDVVSPHCFDVFCAMTCSCADQRPWLRIVCAGWSRLYRIKVRRKLPRMQMLAQVVPDDGCQEEASGKETDKRVADRPDRSRRFGWRGRGCGEEGRGKEREAESGRVG